MKKRQFDGNIFDQGDHSIHYSIAEYDEQILHEQEVGFDVVDSLLEKRGPILREPSENNQQCEVHVKHCAGTFKIKMSSQLNNCDSLPASWKP